MRDLVLADTVLTLQPTRPRLAGGALFVITEAMSGIVSYYRLLAIYDLLPVVAVLLMR